MAGWLIVVSTRGWISVGPGPMSVRCGGWKDVIFLVAASCLSVISWVLVVGASLRTRPVEESWRYGVGGAGRGFNLARA